MQSEGGDRDAAAELEWRDELILELQKELKVAELELEALRSTVSALQVDEGQERPKRAKKRLQPAEGPSKGHHKLRHHRKKRRVEGGIQSVYAPKFTKKRRKAAGSHLAEEQATEEQATEEQGQGQEGQQGGAMYGIEGHCEEWHDDGSDSCGDETEDGGLGTRPGASRKKRKKKGKKKRRVYHRHHHPRRRRD